MMKHRKVPKIGRWAKNVVLASFLFIVLFVAGAVYGDISMVRESAIVVAFWYSFSYVMAMGEGAR